MIYGLLIRIRSMISYFLNNFRLLRLRQTTQLAMITTTACHTGQQQHGLARGIAAKYNGA